MAFTNDTINAINGIRVSIMFLHILTMIESITTPISINTIVCVSIIK